MRSAGGRRLLRPLGRMADWCSRSYKAIMSLARSPMIHGSETLPQRLARLLGHPGYNRGYHRRLHFLLIVKYFLVFCIHLHVILVCNMLKLLWKLHHLARIHCVAQTLDRSLAIWILISRLVRVKAILSHILELLHVLEIFQIWFYSSLCHESK